MHSLANMTSTCSMHVYEYVVFPYRAWASLTPEQGHCENVWYMVMVVCGAPLRWFWNVYMYVAMLIPLSKLKNGLFLKTPLWSLLVVVIRGWQIFGMETKFDAEKHDPVTLSVSTPSSNVCKDPIACPSPPWHILLMTLSPSVAVWLDCLCLTASRRCHTHGKRTSSLSTETQA